MSSDHLNFCPTIAPSALLTPAPSKVPAVYLQYLSASAFFFCKLFSHCSSLSIRNRISFAHNAQYYDHLKVYFFSTIAMETMSRTSKSLGFSLTTPFSSWSSFQGNRVLASACYYMANRTNYSSPGGVVPCGISNSPTAFISCGTVMAGGVCLLDSVCYKPNKLGRTYYLSSCTDARYTAPPCPQISDALKVYYQSSQ